jgi:predicted RNA-binding protein with TRAM domain
MVDRLMKRSQRNAKNRSKRTKKCPVQVGNEYEVDIVDTTPNGVGIAKVKGLIVLVRNTEAGDHKKVVITNTDRLSAEAKIVA